jgi:uncharacterized protein
MLQVQQTFRNMTVSTKNIVVWEGTEWKSIECLNWKEENKEPIITSHITGYINNIPFGIHYMIELDPKWQTQHFLVSDLNNPDNVIELYSDSKGKWFDRDEAVAPLEGCMDIDITLTPFTNSLPIRRLDPAPGRRTMIEVVYIRIPEFTFEKVQQYYTNLGNHRYLFETGNGDFKAELEFDKNFMVTDYPELFKRIFPL